jgi:hypothetical protein
MQLVALGIALVNEHHHYALLRASASAAQNPAESLTAADADASSSASSAPARLSPEFVHVKQALRTSLPLSVWNEIERERDMCLCCFTRQANTLVAPIVLHRCPLYHRPSSPSCPA